MRLLGLLLATALVFPAMTGRDYYNELRKAGEFNRFSDEWVCFSEQQDAEKFAVVSKVSSIVARMQHAGGGKLDHSQEILASDLKNSLFIETYFKGVSSGSQFLDPEGTDQNAYALVFEKPFAGKIEYRFNWATGRYRFMVYAYSKSRTVPTSDEGGKCELIHPE